MKTALNQVTPAIEVSLGWIEIISLISGIASLILAIFAIWLSITFYKMSNESSKEIRQSSDNINNNVSKLEKIFDTMYTDTFGMVKDTVDHMRKQTDKTSEVDIAAEVQKKIEEAVTIELSKVQTDNLSKDQVKDLVMDIVEKSKDTEVMVQINSIKNQIIAYLRSYGSASYERLRDAVFLEKNFSKKSVSIFNQAISDLVDAGIIENPYSLHNGRPYISPLTAIELKVKK